MSITPKSKIRVNKISILASSILLIIIIIGFALRLETESVIKKPARVQENAVNLTSASGNKRKSLVKKIYLPPPPIPKPIIKKEHHEKISSQLSEPKFKYKQLKYLTPRLSAETKRKPEGVPIPVPLRPKQKKFDTQIGTRIENKINAKSPNGKGVNKKKEIHLSLKNINNGYH